MTLITNGSNTSTTTTNMMSANTRIAADTIVHLGKDQRPLSVMKLAAMENPSWKRGATFNHLAKVM